ncbi:hypothetical protein Pcinc_018444 [Petrolisthes cinctipes]|uniref:Chitin-binding type-2 domain-containing protein n=1 Tax=Petrolisthes cinctipes TaxID=88211 RepID=A0AAE1KJ40_PETCI|nr:hypothetical protein Pcinc_018444 [Petrolisthes cinctipes]
MEMQLPTQRTAIDITSANMKNQAKFQLNVPGITHVWGFTQSGSCIPEDCTNVGGVDYNIADPKNCQKYYICHDGSAFSRNCAPLFYYDDSLQQCLLIPACPPTYQPCSPTCRFECQGNQPSAHRNDCTKYYICDPEQGLVERTCSDHNNPFWDGTQCQNDEDNCCDPCMAYCLEGFTNIADPLNCHQYYECMKDDYFPDDSDLRLCSTNEYFSPTLGSCSSDSSCTQICSNDANCPDTFDCPTDAVGGFPVCSNRCNQFYYYCDLFGVEVRTCTHGEFFNPDELVCVDEEDCPYPYFPWVPSIALENVLH